MFQSNYVCRRLLYDICDILAPVDDDLESFYMFLVDWMVNFTDKFGRRIIPLLPEQTDDPDQLLNDLTIIYAGILDSQKDRDSNFTCIIYCNILYDGTL